MNTEKLTREELFALVWERPLSEIAQDFDVSVAELGKLCKKLQVPKPARAYWAQIMSGERPKRPPLVEFSDYATAKRHKLHTKRHTMRLTPRHYDYMKLALAELSSAGVDTSSCQLTTDIVRELSPEMAAQVLLLTQTRFESWIKELSPTSQVSSSSFNSLRRLVEKLLPIAKEQILILEEYSGHGRSDSTNPKIMIFLNAAFLQQIANLHQTVVDNKLSYAVYPLQGWEHAWWVQFLSHYEGYARVRSWLCVSKVELWVKAERCHDWGDTEFETVKIPLASIAPTLLLAKAEVQVPTTVNASKLMMKKSRITAFRDAERAFSLFCDAVYPNEQRWPDDHLALVERLCLDEEAGRTLAAAQDVIAGMERRLDIWEKELELEGMAICSKALGVTEGDTVIINVHDKLVRIRVEIMSACFSDEKLGFQLGGRRYRKDGILGKRYDSVYITVSMDHG